MIHWWAYQQDHLRHILLANKEKYTSGVGGMEECLGIDEPIKARYYTECYGTVEYEKKWIESREQMRAGEEFLDETLRRMGRWESEYLMILSRRVL